MPHPDSVLERATKLALEAHQGQRDWNGRPFILHPLRVSMALLERYEDESLAAAGVLHDAVEDSDGIVTTARISAEVSPAVADIVSVLTHAKAVPYDDYILAIAAAGKWTTLVKLADLTDNLSPFRLLVGNEKQRAAFLKHGVAFDHLMRVARENCWL